MKCICFMVTCLSVTACHTQVLRSPLQANYLQTVAYSRQFTDVFSFTSNQAALAGKKNTAIGIYSERRFMLNELKRVTAAFIFPCLDGGAGITADYSGFAGYNESHAGIAFGRRLGEKIDLGAQFNYYRIGMATYGNAGALNFEVGAILHLTGKLQAGCHVYNPVGGTFGKSSGEKLASIYSFGAGYDASEKLFLSLEIGKEANQPVTVNVAMHYAFIEQFFIRGGIISATGSFFAGSGFSWSNFRIDMAAEWHPRVGLTPSLLLVFNLIPEKKQQE